MYLEIRTGRNLMLTPGPVINHGQQLAASDSIVVQVIYRDL